MSWERNKKKKSRKNYEGERSILSFRRLPPEFAKACQHCETGPFGRHLFFFFFSRTWWSRTTWWCELLLLLVFIYIYIITIYLERLIGSQPKPADYTWEEFRDAGHAPRKLLIRSFHVPQVYIYYFHMWVCIYIYTTPRLSCHHKFKNDIYPFWKK